MKTVFLTLLTATLLLGLVAPTTGAAGPSFPKVGLPAAIKVTGGALVTHVEITYTIPGTTSPITLHFNYRYNDATADFLDKCKEAELKGYGATVFAIWPGWIYLGWAPNSAKGKATQPLSPIH